MSLPMRIRRRLALVLRRLASRLHPEPLADDPAFSGFDLIPKGQYDYVPKDGYVFGPGDRFLLVPKNRYRAKLLPGQKITDELGVGWITEDNSADGYDRLWGDASNLAAFRAEAGHVRDVLGAEIADFTVQHIPEKAKVIDIGCGIGDLLVDLRARLPGIRISGLDFSPKAIEGAKATFPDGDFRVHLIEKSLPYPDDSYDVVFCTDVLEHLEHPHSIAAELVRICRPEGMVVIVVPDGAVDQFLGHYWFWSAESLSELLKEWSAEISLLPQSKEYIACIRVEAD